MNLICDKRYVSNKSVIKKLSSENGFTNISVTNRLLVFILFFSSIFWIFRTIDSGKILFVDLSEVSGLPWLYSSIGLIFSILAAFTIQKEWEHWNELTEAINGEVNALRELLLRCRHVPECSESIIVHTEQYLLHILEGWPTIKAGIRSEEGERIVSLLRNDIVEISTGPGKVLLLPLLDDIISSRNKRIFQSRSHIPRILKNTLVFADIIMIVLSLFVGVKNPLLDYIFTVSIGVLAYTIYLVIDDLDSPFRPGAWHLSSDEYKVLLEQIRKDGPASCPELPKVRAL